MSLMLIRDYWADYAAKSKHRDAGLTPKAIQDTHDVLHTPTTNFASNEITRRVTTDIPEHGIFGNFLRSPC